jgi:ribosomal protein S18 acetylase RimI-like enzyme
MVKIRKATKKDLKEISKLMYEYNEYENKLNKEVELLSLEENEKEDKIFFDLGTSYFILEDSKGIHGALTANLERRGKELAGVLYTLIISKDSRGKGYGKKLVKFVINYFKEKGCRRIRTFVHTKNKNAKAFWEKQKFELEEGYFATRMLK